MLIIKTPVCADIFSVDIWEKRGVDALSRTTLQETAVLIALLVDQRIVADYIAE
jgi:hypothetical protein